MERACLKRMRSEESPYALQTKMHVNQKIVDAHDSNKMNQIYDKTTKLLFQAARCNSSANGVENYKKIPIWRLVRISGNGQVEKLKDSEEFEEHLLWERAKAKCCNRLTFVQGDCGNCQKSLCEYDGFSCSECRQFICNTCVTIFGSGDPDYPICEKCSLFA